MLIERKKRKKNFNFLSNYVQNYILINVLRWLFTLKLCKLPSNSITSSATIINWIGQNDYNFNDAKCISISRHVLDWVQCTETATLHIYILYLVIIALCYLYTYIYQFNHNPNAWTIPKSKKKEYQQLHIKHLGWQISHECVYCKEQNLSKTNILDFVFL